jgi:signal transduction histidine kinase
VAAGLVAVANRPGNRTGPLMVAGGLLLLAGTVSSADSAAAFTIGTLLGPLPQAVFAHLLLAFPEGRLHSRAERVLVAVAYLDVTVVQVVMSLFMDYRTVDGCPCPPTELFVLHHDQFHTALMASQRLVGVAIWLVVIAVFAARWRRASPPLRRSLAPVLGTGGVAVTVVGVGLIVEQAWGSSVAEYLGLVALLAVSLVPAGFLVGLLRSRLARAAVGDLVIELGRPMAAGDLRNALSRAIGDPSLELVYRRPDTDTYVDLDGRRVDPPPPGSGRSVTYVERDGRAIAAAIHDATLTDDPSLIQAACAAAGLALENERLQAELRARLDDLRASRARIVTAGDVARRRLERNLHDVAQQRLVSIAVMLSLVPALLTDRGLAAALRALAGRAPMRVVVDVRLDPATTAPGSPPGERLLDAVEAAAYYFLSEAVTNATKHARASEVVVTVTRRGERLGVTVADDGVGGLDLCAGSGLRGLVDRVEALDGHLTVTSPRGRGTILVAELPCPVAPSLPESRSPAVAPSLTPES